MKQRLLIGTNNPSKLKLMRSYVDPDQAECISPIDLSIHVDAPENARSAAGNALQKALAFHRATGLPVLTEDSGLIFLDLPLDHPDQPGVHVRRPAGRSTFNDDEEMLQYYANVIHRHGGTLRAAWQDAWCLLKDESHYATYADDVDTLSQHAMVLVDTPCEERHPGWPLDSLTFSKASNKYWAAMSIEEWEKDAAFESDRRQLIAWLQNQIDSLL